MGLYFGQVATWLQMDPLAAVGREGDDIKAQELHALRVGETDHATLLTRDRSVRFVIPRALFLRGDATLAAQVRLLLQQQVRNRHDRWLLPQLTPTADRRTGSVAQALSGPTGWLS